MLEKLYAYWLEPSLQQGLARLNYLIELTEYSLPKRRLATVSERKSAKVSKSCADRFYEIKLDVHRMTKLFLGFRIGIISKLTCK